MPFFKKKKIIISLLFFLFFSLLSFSAAIFSYMYFYELELKGGEIEIIWIVALIYNIFGKWGVVCLFCFIGLLPIYFWAKEMEIIPERIPSGIPRGFPHLNQINNSLKLLYQHLTENDLKKFNKDPYIAISTNENNIISIQNIARFIANYYEIPVRTIVVSFISNMSAPGRVELSPSQDFFIEIHEKYKNNQESIITILVHEITHIFLYKKGINLSIEAENEILTDTTAAYLGLGIYILKSFKQELKYISSNEIHKSIEYFGYLTPEEFGYILAKRNIAFNKFQKILEISPIAKTALLYGNKKLNRELSIPPLLHANKFKKYVYLIKKTRAKKILKKSIADKSHIFASCKYDFDLKDKFYVLFRCPICSQILRVPSLGIKIVVNCPICKIKLNCQP